MKKKLIVISEDELDLLQLKRKIISMLTAYNMNFKEEAGDIEMNNITIIFKLSNEPINYRQYDSILGRELNQNLGTLINLLKEEKDDGSN